MTTKKRSYLALFTITLFASNFAVAQDENDMQWAITPYAWFPTTTVDVKFRDTNIGSGEIDFKDVLDVLDGAFMLHVEGGRGTWSAFADITYVNTSDTTERDVLTIDADNEQVLIDAVVAYWPSGVGSPLSFFGGVRYSGLDNQFRFRLGDTELGTQSSSNDYYDALLGVRYRFDLNDKWAILTRADYSAGDSEASYLLRASLAYTVGKRQQNKVLFGYQYRQAEYKEGDLQTDLQLSGFMAGFSFQF
jgi:hypothetical protein